MRRIMLPLLPLWALALAQTCQVRYTPPDYPELPFYPPSLYLTVSPSPLTSPGSLSLQATTSHPEATAWVRVRWQGGQLATRDVPTGGYTPLLTPQNPVQGCPQVSATTRPLGYEDNGQHTFVAEAVEARPPLEAFLEGMVYVGQAPGLLPQGAGASLGQIRFCPTGCSGRPLGGGWYRTEGLSPQGASPAFPDRPVRAQGVAEPLFPRQWNLRLARFPEAWAQATGVGVAVAVPDTGVLGGHPDLQGALLPGLDLLEGDTDPEEPPTGSPLQNFHGSHVAGILAAPWQGVGMAGASQAQVLPIRLLTPPWPR